MQPRRGFERVRSNQPFALQKILYTPHCNAIVSYRLKVAHHSSLLLKITAVQTSLGAAVRAVCSRMTSAEHWRKLFTPLQTCDGIYYINIHFYFIPFSSFLSIVIYITRNTHAYDASRRALRMRVGRAEQLSTLLV